MYVNMLDVQMSPMKGTKRASIIISPVLSFGFLIIFCPVKFFFGSYLKRDSVGHIGRKGI